MQENNLVPSCVINGVLFLKSAFNPYSWLRHDVWKNQFKVTIVSQSSEREQDSLFAIGNAATLSQAVNEAQRFGQSLGGSLNQFATVSITAVNGRLVLSGILLGGSIVWIQPVFDQTSRQKINSSIFELESRIAESKFVGSALQLKERATVLRKHLVDPLFKSIADYKEISYTHVWN